MSIFNGKKIIGLALISILGAIADGITNGWNWRQYAISAIGIATIVVRAYFTDADVTENLAEKK